MPDDPQYTLRDLARLGGTTARTVRYYIAQGLLPPADGVGAGAHYTDGHLERLRVIRRLQRAHLPLAEIRRQLDTLGAEDVARLAAPETPAPPTGTALDYVRSVLGTRSEPVPGVPSPAAAPAAARPATPRMVAPLRSLRVGEAPPPYASEVAVETRPEASPATGTGAPDATTAPATGMRSQWDRIALTPDIEIHVRRPLSRLENRRVERLITIARTVLQEELT